MTTHELETGQTVIVAVVPRAATDLRINEEFSNPLYSVLYCNNTEEIYDVIEFAKHEISIVGTIQYKGSEHFFNSPWWRDLGFKSPDECISRLASWGYYWDNPLGEKPTMDHPRYNTIIGFDVDHYSDDLTTWELAESRKLSIEQMVVVIQFKK